MEEATQIVAEMDMEVEFEQVGGFNEQLAVAYNDVDFCLKLQQQGYRNIFLPHVQLYHYESQSRNREDTLEPKQRIHQEVAYMETTWNKLINHDPGLIDTYMHISDKAIT